MASAKHIIRVMKSWGIIVRYLVIFSLLTVSLSACKEGGGCGGLFQRGKGAGASVTVERVKVKEVSPVVTITGKLVPNNKADISYPNDVKVQEVYAGIGDTVLAGDSLFRLAEDEMNNNLSVARARRIELEALVDKNNNLLRSRESLLEEGKIDQDELNRLEKEIASQEAELERIKAEISKLTYNLDHVVVNSPIAGVVTRRDVSSGSVANAGAILFRVINTNPIIVSLPVDVKLSEDIAVDTELDITVLALPDKKFVAKVTYVNPEISRSGNTFDVWASVSNDDFLLKSGMAVTTEFASDKLQRSYLIPVSSVLSKSSRPYVYKVSKGLAHKTPITIGSISGGQVEVVRGLERRDLVVVKGAEDLYDGADVSMWSR